MRTGGRLHKPRHELEKQLADLISIVPISIILQGQMRYSASQIWTADGSRPSRKQGIQNFNPVADR